MYNDDFRHIKKLIQIDTKEKNILRQLENGENPKIIEVKVYFEIEDLKDSRSMRLNFTLTSEKFLELFKNEAIEVLKEENRRTTEYLLEKKSEFDRINNYCEELKALGFDKRGA